MKKAKLMGLSLLLAFFGVPALAQIMAFAAGVVAAFLALILDITNAPVFMHYLANGMVLILAGAAMFIAGWKCNPVNTGTIRLLCGVAGKVTRG
ncbi:hypothetical protein [Superficieibacter electus]|uniref:hypothetical protein n=1 Tax=Superficieibacter electus TaxID=2022662 RepID=UPI0010571E5A|nr:hypothetical protein [Superficieibacter electus]